jgi:hypothetical protein
MSCEQNAGENKNTKIKKSIETEAKFKYFEKKLTHQIYNHE